MPKLQNHVGTCNICPGRSLLDTHGTCRGVAHVIILQSVLTTVILWALQAVQRQTITLYSHLNIEIVVQNMFESCFHRQRIYRNTIDTDSIN